MGDVLSSETKKEAEEAADEAQDQSEIAADAAAEAVLKAEEAAKAAEEAKAAYEKAQAEFEKAEKEAQEQYQAGLIEMQKAVEMTEQAAAEAQKRYEEMLAAQEAADAAAEKAQAEVDAAKENLQGAVEDLNKVIAENAAEVAEKTATAAATGIALEAAKVAADAAQKVVDNLQGQIDELQTQVDALDAVIADADAAIADAQEKLDALDEEDAAYPTAVKELEAAQAAKEEAQRIKDNAQTIIDAKAEAEAEGGYAEQMEQLQNKLNDDTATVDDKKALTELVLQNIKDYEDLGEGSSDVEINWVNDNVFELDGELYEVKTAQREDGTKYLQYHKTESKYETVSKLPDEKEVYQGGENAGEESTAYKAIGPDGQEYDVKVVCTSKVYKVPTLSWPFYKEVTEYYYKYEVNGEALYYDSINKTYSTGTTLLGNKIEFTIEDTSKQYFDTEEVAIGTNSDSISEKWEEAANAEENLSKAEEALEKAESDHAEAEKVYNAAKGELTDIKGSNEEIKVATQKQVEQLNAQIDELDKKLNGGVGDQLLRALIEGDVEAAGKGAAKIAALEIKAGLGIITEEEQKELDELKGSTETSKEMLEILKGLSDGKLDIDDAKKIVGMLGESNVSAKTRLAIANAVEDVFEKQYEKAVDELEEAVETAKEETKKQLDVVVEARKEKLEKDIALADALVQKQNAAKAVADAADVKSLADQAVEDAKAAYEAYKAMEDKYHPDDVAVLAAKAAYEAAQKHADDAQAAAEAALWDAARAQMIAFIAQRYADLFFERPEEAIFFGSGGAQTIAQYAYSLRGTISSDFSGGVQMLNATFVEAVFANNGVTVSLSSNNAADVKAAGTPVANSDVRPGDIVCILAEDGVTVERFGIYYGDGIYVFYNETSGAVETGNLADALYGWFAIRVA